jgi:hypothetical protein
MCRGEKSERNDYDDGTSIKEEETTTTIRDQI